MSSRNGQEFAGRGVRSEAFASLMPLGYAVQALMFLPTTWFTEDDT